jgi:chromosome partitioning protein
VINAATPGARITAEAAIALSQHGTVAPVTIHSRTDFAASMIDGRTAMELDPKSASSQEITKLWEYLSTRLNKGARPTVLNMQGQAPARRKVFGQRGLATARQS